MAKTHTTLSIDNQILQEAKLIINNISGEFEDFLRMRISNIKGDTTTTNLLLLEKELSKEENALNKISISVKTKRENLQLLKTHIEKQEIKRITAEKEKAEAVLKCVLCGGSIEGEKKELAYTDSEGREFYHHKTCFMDQLNTHKWKDKEAYLKWLKEVKQ